MSVHNNIYGLLSSYLLASPNLHGRGADIYLAKLRAADYNIQEYVSVG
jgi:hypothetical protein